LKSSLFKIENQIDLNQQSRLSEKKSALFIRFSYVFTRVFNKDNGIFYFIKKTSKYILVVADLFAHHPIFNAFALKTQRE